MKLLFLFGLVWSMSPVIGFTVVSKGCTRSKVQISMARTAAEIIAEARRKVGYPQEEESDESPKLFEDDLVEDMTSSLRILEKRVEKGPGSLDASEVSNFEEMMTRILEEMKLKAKSGTEAVTAPTSTQFETSSIAPESDNEVTAPAPMSLTAKNGYGVTDMSQDEGPAYDGTGGMGMARGTKSSYVLEGMEEMSPEEYRSALQASISARQDKRRETGEYGNKAAESYLHALGWGGASGALGGKSINTERSK